MGVIFSAGYSLPSGDELLTHARIAHSSNWIAGTVTASTTHADYFADGPDNSMTYEKWQPTALPATWELDFGGSNAVEYCAIAAHDMGTKGNSLQVQRYDSGSWTDMIPTTAIADDMPIFCLFSETADTKYRIRVSSGSVPTIGVIRFGVALQMERAIYGGHSPLDMARMTTMRATRSESGEFLGRTKVRTKFATSFDWSNLTAAWVRTNWRPFQLAVETEPFFIAWRPITFSEVGYCQAPQVPIPSNSGTRDLMSVSLDVEALGYD